MSIAYRKRNWLKSLETKCRRELADHTRLLYMAATRAGRRLVIFSEHWDEQRTHLAAP